MTFKFIFGFLPVLVLFTNTVPNGYAGINYGPVIRILNKFKQDEGLVQHELHHAKIWWTWFVCMSIGLSLFSLTDPTFAVYAGNNINQDSLMFILGIAVGFRSLMYKFIESVRFKDECACYQIQARYYDDDRTLVFAGFVAKDYGLSYTVEQALVKIRDGDYGQNKRAARI